MKLNHFLNSLSLALLLLSLSLASVLYYFVYLPAIESEVRSQQERELLAVQMGVKFAQRNLEVLCYDYAVWDEMVDFVTHRGSDFSLSSLNNNAFEAANIDGAYLFDIDGKLLWHYSNDEQLFPQSLPQNNKDWIGLVLPDRASIEKQTPTTRSGLISLGRTVVYFSNTSVLPSDEKGNVVGSLLMVRIINSKLTEEIKQLSLVNFSLDKLDPNNKYDGLKTFNSVPTIESLSAQHMWLINDVFETPALKISVTHDRNLSPSLFTPESAVIFCALILVSIGTIIPISVMVLKPIRTANRVLVRMAGSGQLIKMKTGWHIDELTKLSISFNQMVDKLERHQNYLESLSYKDSLTGVANRRSLEVFAQRAYEQWGEGKGLIGFLMIDIDNFKDYNDTQGHLAGDKAILTIAQTLLLECRRRGELLTRYGGEEFCVVIHGDNIAQMELLSKRMLNQVWLLNLHHPKGSHGKRVTVSIGGCLYERFHPSFSDITWEMMIGQADIQLYKAKTSGR
ncbi:MAG: diguanylate cyclase (GGDEF)-like protein, partial [Shewanella sp.]